MSEGKDSLAFHQVIQENKGIIYKIARAYCKDEIDRQDLIQEIMIQIWKSFDKYNPTFARSTWIYRIALNVAISHYRSSVKIKDKVTYIDDVVALSLEPSNTEKTEQIEKLYQLIDELDRLDKALILLYLDNKSHEEISEITGLSKSNVGTKIGRIKEKLKVKFKQ
jgi:RNA polymerase sigma factor (sigma-70 family)